MTTLVSPAALPDDLGTVLRRIEYLERWTNTLGAAIQTAVGPTVTDLRAQQSALASAQQTLADQQLALASAQQTLADQGAALVGQVSQLAAAQAQITTLVGSQVVPAAATAYAAGFDWSTSNVDRAQVSVPVPAGYTRAAVVALGFASGSVADYYEMWASVRINGQAGTESWAGVWQGSPNLACFNAATLSGLSGGSVTAAVAGRTNLAVPAAGAVANKAITTLIVTFQR